jgi:hypothetical protein
VPDRKTLNRIDELTNERKERARNIAELSADIEQ